MFTSSNPFPSSTHGFLPTNSGIIFGQEKDGVYFSHYPFVTGACSFDPPPPIKENSDNNMNLSDSVISPSRKRVAASKKDRHSKIFTAQGPRDRRVRLSIDISRKFFGLQDLLGFDKASKTLDWLFTKSTIAIKDLVEEMKHTSSSTLSDQCEQVFMEKGDHLEKKGKVPKCVNGGKKKKKTTQKQKSVSHVNLGARKQLRAEARARARVRTIEKLRIKKLNIDVKNVLGDTNYCSLQSTGGNQVQSQSNNEVKFGESYVEQKLPKPYSLIYNSQFKNSTH